MQEIHCYNSIAQPIPIKEQRIHHTFSHHTRHPQRMTVRLKGERSPMVQRTMQVKALWSRQTRNLDMIPLICIPLRKNAFSRAIRHCHVGMTTPQPVCTLRQKI